MYSNFKKDLSREQQLSALVLPAIQKEIGGDYKQTDNKDEQLSGIDVFWKKNGKEYLIDIKAALDYFDKPDMKTFVFESSLSQKKIRKPGWFVDSNKKTQVYFLITEVQTKEKSGKIEDITQFKLIMVSRSKVTKKLASRGISIQIIIDLDKNLRADNSRTTKKFVPLIIPGLDNNKEGILLWSVRLPEKPVNLLLYTDFLLSDCGAKAVTIYL